MILTAKCVIFLVLDQVMCEDGFACPSSSQDIWVNIVFLFELDQMWVFSEILILLQLMEESELVFSLSFLEGGKADRFELGLPESFPWFAHLIHKFFVRRCL